MQSKEETVSNMGMDKIKGIIYVCIGAASYGVLATIIKLGYNNGLGTAGLTFAQFLFGAVVLSSMAFFMNKGKQKVSEIKTESKYPKLKLMLFGTTMGLTSTFYYLAIQYVPVSVGIILLMQTVWMGILMEFFIDRNLVTRSKLIGAVVVMFGTLLASRVFESDFDFSYIGFAYGLLAAVCYTISLYASNKVAIKLPNIVRSKYLILGGFCAILIYWNTDILHDLNSIDYIKWGFFLGLFGTILPPILFNKGVPQIGNGLTSILATLEIPVSIFSAYLMLHEQIGFLQFTGILLILITIILINLKRKKV